MNKDYIYPFLEDLQSRIDEKEEELIISQWKDYADGKATTYPFTATKRTAKPSKMQWEDFNINHALKSQDKMILSQFRLCSKILENGSNGVMQIRPNYGVGILPSLYNVEMFIMPEKMNTLPNVKPFKNGLDDVAYWIDKGVPDLSNGFGADVFEFTENIVEIFKDFPLLSKYIFFVHPDCQGPMDICELLWGSELFADMYDEPELVHALLAQISDTYEVFLDKWFKLANRPMGYHSFFNKLHKGNITVRDDSAMNMSKAFYEEFIGPYNQRVLEHFDGGAIHFCGTGDHFISSLSELPSVYGVDMSQPHLNNMDIILSNTVNKGLTLFSPANTYLTDLNMDDYKTNFLYVK
ncbi:MAG: uroporphyrinogen decarboxylase family protein [Clostridia bacterium]